MTDSNYDVRELPIKELTSDELDTVSGGTPLTNAIITVVKFLAAYDKKFGVPITSHATELT